MTIYARYEHNDSAAIGVVRDGMISALGTDSLHDLLSDRTPEQNDTTAVAVEDVTLLPPVASSSRIIGVGMNYHDALPPGVAIPAYPVLFTKFHSGLVGANDPIVMPRESVAVDAEGELAIVIGRRGRRIPEASALSHVLGCTIVNDVTIRDFQGLSAQWVQGKAWDSTTPLGPWIVPYDRIPPDARIRTTIDGVVVQDGRLDNMIFSVPRLVSIISTFMTLDIGDVILTGTPAGNGHSRVPQQYLTAGQVVEVGIEGIGVIRNTTVLG